MSISHKKINSMIKEVVENSDDNYDEKSFRELCHKIYLIESSVDERSGRKILNEIRDEIIRRASDITSTGAK